MKFRFSLIEEYTNEDNTQILSSHNSDFNLDDQQ